VITLDGYAASHRAVDKLKTSGILPRRVQVRSCKYLNNVIEQDHRRIKQRVRPMLGFKRFETATVIIRGIELAEKIKKHQFNLRPLSEKATTAPEMWARVLAAEAWKIVHPTKTYTYKNLHQNHPRDVVSRGQAGRRALLRLCNNSRGPAECELSARLEPAHCESYREPKLAGILPFWYQTPPNGVLEPRIGQIHQ
jgi:DDE domain